jgi:single-strand DNA-binding protein
MNNVVLIGRLTRDPELRYIPGNGTPVSTFTLAVDKGLSKDKKNEMELSGKPTADFIRIVVWGKQGENCANYLAKGRLVGIQGRIQTGSYDANDGTKRYTTDIVANQVTFLEWGDKQNSDYEYQVPEGFHPIDNDDIPF